MELTKYGPFAQIVVVACALVATFSLLVLQTIGRVKRWTWLTTYTPPFVVTTAARLLAIAVMAITFITINKGNYLWFASGAVLTGLFGFITIYLFNSLRERNVIAIEEVGEDGGPLLDKKGAVVNRYIVVGVEKNMRREAKAALTKAREERGGLSLKDFMAGYGAQKVNNPGAIWDDALLADLRNRLTLYLMIAVLLGSLTLFLASLSIDVFNR